MKRNKTYDFTLEIDDESDNVQIVYVPVLEAIQPSFATLSSFHFRDALLSSLVSD